MNGPSRGLSTVLGLVLASAVSLACATAEPAAPRYPLVFDKAKVLRTLGLVVRPYTSDAEDTQAFPTRCYYYGDGSYDISLSDDLLARFKVRGFSRRSLCMALVSEMRFDPETGQRLPTYIVANVESLSQPGYVPGAGELTAELPLDVQDCFKNGTPYADCRIQYDPMTGRKLTARQTQAYKQAGAALDKKLREPAFKNAFKYIDKCETAAAKPGDDCEFTAGMITIGAAQKALGVGAPSRATFYDYASDFPSGFGYALYARPTDVPPAAVQRIAKDKSYLATEASVAQVAERLKPK
jgi:hypothetical protein